MKERYDRDVGSFERGGRNRIEVLRSAASGDVAWWTGYQIAEARLKGKTAPVSMKLRVTEAFRFRDGGWRLVHRHAEGLPPDDAQTPSHASVDAAELDLILPCTHEALCARHLLYDPARG